MNQYNQNQNAGGLLLALASLGIICLLGMFVLVTDIDVQGLLEEKLDGTVQTEIQKQTAKTGLSKATPPKVDLQMVKDFLKGKK